jgi:HAD superfamily hydrolase (TIGR01549 family)
MTNKPIHHVWFDLGETINIHSPEFTKVRDDLKAKLYAELVNKPVSQQLEEEYRELYKKYGSNSSVFAELGKPSDFWQAHFSQIDKTKFYKPDSRVYGTLKKLKTIVSISLFSNIKPDEIIRTLGLIKVDPAWFTFIISGDEVGKRKPDPEGFHKIIAKSNLPPEEILYVGDRVNVDIKPAKALGMQTCLVWANSKEADYSCDSFEKILTIFA